MPFQSRRACHFLIATVGVADSLSSTTKHILYHQIPSMFTLIKCGMLSVIFARFPANEFCLFHIVKCVTFVAVKYVVFLAIKCAMFLSIKCVMFLSIKCVMFLSIKCVVFLATKCIMFLAIKCVLFLDIKCVMFLTITCVMFPLDALKNIYNKHICMSTPQHPVNTSPRPVGLQPTIGLY
ncbi:hypothetical protein HAZT_HAZT000303 [Hyalella azteca]|uniref:Uncharacterized protein n=1 Tax=Hyalella azteca TaxID=294128 RepID=A0A6A0H6U1_HYAAZ|nr:hypothetical protein HAZT_HAZT000303 [Hyalella azteca]